MRDYQSERNDSKESESIRKGLRAESLFRYIEKKEKELREQRLALLKSIVAKQRQKIAYESRKWDEKLKKRKIKPPKLISPKEPVAVAIDSTVSKSSDTLSTKYDRRSISPSLTGSRLTSGKQSLSGSRTLFENSRPLRQDSIMSKNNPIMLELQEHKELPDITANVELVGTTCITVPAKDPTEKKNGKQNNPNNIEDSEAISKVFKTYDAFIDFQRKYTKPLEEIEIIQSGVDHKRATIETRKLEVKKLHIEALKNRTRIAQYLSGEATSAMGIPFGFSIDPHPITDQIKKNPIIEEETDEKVTITDDFNISINGKLPLVSGKRNSFSVATRASTRASLDTETESDGQKLEKSLIDFAQVKVRRGSRHSNEILNENEEFKRMDDSVSDREQQNEHDKKRMARPNRQQREEIELVQSLSVMAEDRIRLESKFLQKKLAQSDSLNKKFIDPNERDPSLNSIFLENEDYTISSLEESPEFLHFPSNSLIPKSNPVQELVEKPNLKIWEHINLKSVEDFGSSLATPRARLSDSLHNIPNSFNAHFQNICNEKQRPKFGEFAASILPLTPDKLSYLEPTNGKYKIPKIVKYWKTFSEFDEDIPQIE